MALPAWIRPLGLAEHFVVGGVLAAVLAALGTPAAARVVAVAAVGIAHELGDGDFTKAEGAPWNGILDLLAFLPVPLVWWVLWEGSTQFTSDSLAERTRPGRLPRRRSLGCG